MAACGDPFHVDFELTGTFVASGRTYLGTLTGHARAYYVYGGGGYPVDDRIDAFTLSGTGPDGRTASFLCAGTTIMDRNQFRLRCNGSVNGGPPGPRPITIVGVSTGGGCSCDFSRVKGIYTGAV